MQRERCNNQFRNWFSRLRGAGQIHRSHMQGERCNQFGNWFPRLRRAGKLRQSHMQGERCTQFGNWFSRLRGARQIRQSHMQGERCNQLRNWFSRLRGAEQTINLTCKYNELRQLKLDPKEFTLFQGFKTWQRTYCTRWKGLCIL